MTSSNAVQTTLILRTGPLGSLTALLRALNGQGIVPDLLTLSGSEDDVRAAGDVGRVYSYDSDCLYWRALNRPLRQQLVYTRYRRVIIMYNNPRGRGYHRVEEIASRLRPGRIDVAVPDGRATLPLNGWWYFIRLAPEPLLLALDRLLLLVIGMVAAVAAHRRSVRLRPDPARILHVIDSLCAGDGQHQLTTVLPLLADERYRHEVALFALGDRAGELPPGVPVHVLETPGEFWGGFWTVRWWRLFRQVRQGGYDLIQCWMFFGNFAGGFAASWAGVPSLLYVMQMQDWKELPGYGRWWYRPVDFLAARAATGVIATAVAVADDYRRWAACREVPVVYSGVDCGKETAYSPGLRETMRARLAVPETAALVGVSARLCPEKDIVNFIHAARAVGDDHPGAIFAVFGDGPLLPYLQERGMAVGVRFFPEPCAFRALRAALDIFVLPSLSEGMPVALLAAGAAGKPCVVTASGGMTEVVEDGAAGWVVPIADTAALAAALGEALGNPDEAAFRGRALQRRIEDNFRLDRTAAGLKQHYRRLLWGEEA